MTNEPIIVTPFDKAVKTLEEALVQPESAIVRDATIQRFEYTFELAIRMVQRYFKEKGPRDLNVETLTNNELCRRAAEAELIEDPKRWFTYRDARDKKLQAYDEGVAEEIFRDARLFLPDAKHLLDQLKKRG